MCKTKVRTKKYQVQLHIESIKGVDELEIQPKFQVQTNETNDIVNG